MSTIARTTSDVLTASQRGEIVADLERLLPAGSVLADEDAVRVYGSDACARFCGKPLAVVLPTIAAQVCEVVRYCANANLKIFPRGGGTSLCGGSAAGEDGIVVCLSRMSRILSIDYESRIVRVEGGCTALEVSKVVATRGFQFAPDPASRSAASIAGHVATSAAGANALKFGTIAEHVLGVQAVLADGEIAEFGGGYMDSPGYDLLGLMMGSEGQLALVTEASLRITPMPERRQFMVFGFDTMADTARCLMGVVGSGILPSAATCMDRMAMDAVEAHARAGLPDGAGAILVLELAGSKDEVAAQDAWMREITSPFAPKPIISTSDDSEAERMRQARDSIFAALGRVAGFFCADGAVPLSALADALVQVEEICASHGVRCASVVPAGDGHICPLVLFEFGNAAEQERAHRACADILAMCIEAGGSLTGAHGIGLDKRDLMPIQFTEADLTLQARLKAAFDDKCLLNPGKMLPSAFSNPARSGRDPHAVRWNTGGAA